MQLWYPAAIKVPLPDAGPFVAGPYRGVLHSTEGGSYVGALGAYKAKGNAPQFTGSWEAGLFVIRQHMPLDRAGSALEHRQGTCHTNRQSAIQLEIVGFAAQMHLAPTGYLDGIRAWMEWLEAQTGIHPTAPGFRPYPASLGMNNGVRMTETTWLAWNGWCGHQHVPNQDHGDPGDIDIAYLLQRQPAAPAAQAAPVSPVHDFEEATMKSALLNIGPLDGGGNGWTDWDPGLGRDPVYWSATLLGPSPPDDGGYWPQQQHVTVAAQPRGGKLRVVVRGGTPSDHVGVCVGAA